MNNKISFISSGQVRLLRLGYTEMLQVFAEAIETGQVDCDWPGLGGHSIDACSGS
jgi:hypothetical protein